MKYIRCVQLFRTPVSSSVVGFGAIIAVHLGLALGQMPPLTGCSIGAIQTRKPKPSFVNEDTRAGFSSTYVKPTSTAECEVNGPTWSWTFDTGTAADPKNPVERWNPDPMPGSWEADPYRPDIIHVFQSSPEGHVYARFPSKGPWRVNLKVTATWTSPSCTSCTATSNLTINFPDVTDCSFKGVVVPEYQFSGRSVTKIGLREPCQLEVRFAAGTTLADVAPLTWECISGGNVIIHFRDNGDGTARFDARFETGQAVFKLTSTRAACSGATVTLDIVAPSNASHTYLNPVPGSGIANGKVSFHIFNRVHIHPKDVAFHNLNFGEGEDDKADLSGEFVTIANMPGNDPNAPHAANGPFGVTEPPDGVEGTYWEKDRCGPPVVTENGGPAAAGFHIWNIPQRWFDLAGGPHDFVVLQQRHDFDGKRTIRIQKGGVDRSGP